MFGYLRDSSRSKLTGIVHTTETLDAERLSPSVMRWSSAPRFRQVAHHSATSEKAPAAQRQTRANRPTGASGRRADYPPRLWLRYPKKYLRYGTRSMPTKLMTQYRNGRVTAIMLTIVAVALAACTTSVAGHPIAAGGHRAPSRSTTQPASTPISASDLLLHDGDRTPFGPAVAMLVGNTFYTSARPPQCSAALLFKDSPLRPAGSFDHDESAYSFGTSAIYAESADVYAKRLNPHDVVWDGFGAVPKCSEEAIGVTPEGESGPMRLSLFAVPADGVLTWTMTSPEWTCNYGLAVARQATLLLVACDTENRIDMAEWASKRREQIMARAA
jgi:hypothetical protein